jgi:hypothetical protein
MKHVLLVLSCLALATGCAGVSPVAPSAPWSEAEPSALVPPPRPEETARAPSPPPPPGASRPEALDRTTEGEKAAALAAPTSGQELGRVRVALGNPAEQGFWLKSALVKDKTPGVIRLANGKTANVDLLPLAGGGPQLSLAAFRALELPLTGLPEVTVLRR